ncbi:MAG: hypothetical protein ABSE05_01145 [Syntrophales bacterium]|jgi:hypothetical protein
MKIVQTAGIIVPIALIIKINPSLPSDIAGILIVQTIPIPLIPRENSYVCLVTTVTGVPNTLMKIRPR